MSQEEDLHRNLMERLAVRIANRYCMFVLCRDEDMICLQLMSHHVAVSSELDVG